MYFKLFCLSSIAILLAVSSCGLRKKIVYFQTGVADSTAVNYTPTLKTDDLLAIRVSADDVESVAPFNLHVEGNPNINAGYSSGNPERNGYLIDEDGSVNIPVLGKVKIGGLKRSYAITLIEDQLKSYVKNPIVNIQILNYKITVLGDVRSPGTFKIPNERITILEAIGLAGDVTITGKRQNVLVVRDNNGKKEQYRMDLTKADEVFSSPAYYLQQNDVVYVEPNVTARTNASFWKTSASIFVSTAAVIISTINVLTK